MTSEEASYANLVIAECSKRSYVNLASMESIVRSKPRVYRGEVSQCGARAQRSL